MPSVEEASAKAFSQGGAATSAIELLPEGSFRVLDMGGQVADIFGANLSGYDSSKAAENEPRRRIQQILAKVREARAPIFTSVIGGMLPNARDRQINTIWLPFGPDRGHVERVISVVALHELVDLVDQPEEPQDEFTKFRQARQGRHL